MNLKYVIVGFVILGFWTSTDAQEKFYRDGVRYFQKGLYQQALKEFEADKYGDKNQDLLLKRVICNYETNNIAAAKRDVSTVLAGDQVPELLYLYIAKIYHSELDFNKAIEYYKEYMKRTSRNDMYRPMVIDEIKRCANGINLQYYDQNAFVENMGPQINTIFDESYPVQSPNYLNKYYFSSNRSDSEGGLRDENGLKDELYGRYNNDMYSAVLENGKWVQVQALNTLLNTSKHEQVLGFNTDGSILFFLKGDDSQSGSIHVDTFGLNKTEVYPPKLSSPIYAEKGDIYLQFYNDSTVIFSSKREGGFGGYDLYVCYRHNLDWSKPKNLGPTINSSYDEITPFLTKDGLHLYFSSNGLKSMGGHDIFRSQYSFEAGGWTAPENMKTGLNSALDDTHYKIAVDGQSAYFRSSRKSSLGQGDIYTAYLKEQELGQLSYNSTLPFIANDQFVKDIASNSRRRLTNRGSTSASNTQVNPAKPTTPEDAKEREFVLEYLYYADDENLFTIQNTKNLDNVVDILNIYPATKIEIDCHSLKESQISFELYFTIKRAEKVSEYLQNKGINKDRILLRGFGANYPLVNRETSAASNKLGDKLNRRLELKIVKSEDIPLKISYNKPVVADFLMDSSSELYATIVQGLSYRVHVASVQQMYQNTVLKEYADAMIEKDFGSDNYEYSIGLYTRYYDAQDVLKSLKEDNISEAKIIPYVNGDKLDVDKIMDHAKKFPDLVNYLQYGGQ